MEQQFVIFSLFLSFQSNILFSETTDVVGRWPLGPGEDYLKFIFYRDLKSALLPAS